MRTSTSFGEEGDTIQPIRSFKTQPRGTTRSWERALVSGAPRRPVQQPDPCSCCKGLPTQERSFGIQDLNRRRRSMNLLTGWLLEHGCVCCCLTSYYTRSGFGIHGTSRFAVLHGCCTFTTRRRDPPSAKSTTERSGPNPQRGVCKAGLCRLQSLWGTVGRPCLSMASAASPEQLEAGTSERSRVLGTPTRGHFL